MVPLRGYGTVLSECKHSLTLLVVILLMTANTRRPCRGLIYGHATWSLQRASTTFSPPSRASTVRGAEVSLLDPIAILVGVRDTILEPPLNVVNKEWMLSS